MALPEMISVEDFFNPPTRTAATISPGGTKIAFLAPWKNRLNVWAQHLDGGDDDGAVNPETMTEMWHAITRLLAPQLGGRA